MLLLTSSRLISIQLLSKQYNVITMFWDVLCIFTGRIASWINNVFYNLIASSRNVVELLLKMQASANIPDQKGCYPLHLAAWRGNAEICKVLITHGPSVANVNAQVNKSLLSF